LALEPLNHKEAASDFAPRPPYPFNLLPSHRSNLAWERSNWYSVSLPHLRDTRLWGLYPNTVRAASCRRQRLVKVVKTASADGFSF